MHESLQGILLPYLAHPCYHNACSDKPGVWFTVWEVIMKKTIWKNIRGCHTLKHSDLNFAYSSLELVLQCEQVWSFFSRWRTSRLVSNGYRLSQRTSHWRRRRQSRTGSLEPAREGDGIADQRENSLLPGWNKRLKRPKFMSYCCFDELLLYVNDV